MKRKVAIVHDNLLEYGGSERVVEALIKIFPHADLYTFFFNTKNEQLSKQFDAHRWHGSFIQPFQWLSFLKQYFSVLKPLAWWHFHHLDLRDYDLVISSTHSYNAKAVKVDKEAVHLSYIHTPPRFLYGYRHELAHLTKLPFLGWFFAYLKRVDFRAAQRPTHLVANSQEVQQRVQKIYRRTAAIVYPPVSVKQVTTKNTAMKHKQYYVAHSRLVKQKGLDLIVRTCTQYELPLKVVGTGYLHSLLQQSAGKTVEFLGFVDDQKLPKLYQSAIALLYAAEEEDFGIVPLEAQMLGVPVIAYRSGGVLETIKEGKTGYYFKDKTPAALYAAVRKLERQPLQPSACVTFAKGFRPEVFARRIEEVLKTR